MYNELKCITIEEEKLKDIMTIIRLRRKNPYDVA